jgi:hypothetical protein
VRAGLAALGLRSLDELIGRADLLAQREAALAKTSGLDLSFLTTYAGETGASSARLGAEVHDNGPQLDDRILADAEVQVRRIIRCLYVIVELLFVVGRLPMLWLQLRCWLTTNAWTAGCFGVLSAQTGWA